MLVDPRAFITKSKLPFEEMSLYLPLFKFVKVTEIRFIAIKVEFEINCNITWNILILIKLNF